MFFFDGRECLLLVNIPSRFTILLIDFQPSNLDYIEEAMLQYMKDIYSDDPEMLRLLERYFEESPVPFYENLTDRSVAAILNHVQKDKLRDGDWLWDYIRGGVMHSKEVNRELNRIPFRLRIGSNTEYPFPVERFAELLKELYAGEDAD